MPTQSSRRSPSHHVKRPHLPEVGSPPSLFLGGSACRREDGTRFKKKRSPRRIFRQVLCYGPGRERPAQRNLRRGFLLDPRKFPGRPPGAPPAGDPRRRFAPQILETIPDTVDTSPHKSVHFGSEFVRLQQRFEATVADPLHRYCGGVAEGGRRVLRSVSGHSI